MIRLDEIEKKANEAIGSKHYEPYFYDVANPDTILKLIEIAKAAKELLDFLDNDIGMDRPQLTWLRSAMRGVE